MERRWYRCANLPRALHHVAIASDGERLHASGGYVGLPFRQDQKAALFAYDPADDRWVELAPLPHPIDQHAMVWHRGMLYLVGGQNGDRDLATLWAYDLAGGEDIITDNVLTRHDVLDLERLEWRDGPPLIPGRHGLAAAVAGGVAYAIGGGKRAGLHTIYSVSGEIFEIDLSV